MAVFEDKQFDEIVAYLNCRYICPYEAVWRMLQFQIHFREPAIKRLPVHLPLHQNIVFNQHAKLEYVANASKLRKTMLTQWFETNVKNPKARELLYIEFPSKFVWDNDEREWK